jgi:thiamine biosynthesis protein ThiS
MHDENCLNSVQSYRKTAFQSICAVWRELQLFLRTEQNFRSVVQQRFVTPLTARSHLDYSSVMNLFINGEEKSFAGSLSVIQLVEGLGVKGDRVAVELNREILPRAQWIETPLKDGDRLEIVHFVGGG